MSQALDRRQALRFLLAAERVGPFAKARTGAFSRDAMARLDAGGPHIAARDLGDHVRELAEEALDLGAWGALAAQHPVCGQLALTLLEVAALGAGAHHLLERNGKQR